MSHNYEPCNSHSSHAYLIFMLVMASHALTGCSTLKDVREARGEGKSQVYDATYNQVWSVIPKAANDLDLSVAGSYPNDRYILLERGVTGFSWGEKVAVFAEPIGSSRTKVEVVSKRKLATNITATNWEKKLLVKIAEYLGLPEQ